jgi:chromosome segregation ATPase
MFKKLTILSVAVVAGLALVSWAGLSTYVSTFCHNVKNKLRSEVPIEFQIQDVKRRVANLVPDMKQHFRHVAEEMVAIDSLKREIEVTRSNLAGQKAALADMTQALDSDEATVAFDGRDYSRDRLKEKVEKDFESYKHCEAELKSKEALLHARQKGLEAAQAQLAEMRHAKDDLEVQIADLEAQLQNVKLAEARNKFHLDDSQLSQCKASIAEIRNRLQVEVKTAELEGNFANDEIPVQKHVKSVSEVTKEVKSYFGEGARPANGKVASHE